MDLCDSMGIKCIYTTESDWNPWLHGQLKLIVSQLPTTFSNESNAKSSRKPVFVWRPWKVPSLCDFSTNFCNLFNLFCNEAGFCLADFRNVEVIDKQKFISRGMFFMNTLSDWKTVVVIHSSVLFWRVTYHLP